VRQATLAFIKRPFVRNVITVTSGTVVAQSIGIAFTPCVTRLYGPEVFGLQGLFMSVVALLSTVAAMSYPVAMVLPKSDEEAIGLARLSIYVAVGVSLIAAIALGMFSNELFSLLKAEAISAYWFLIPVAMFSSVLGAVLSQWLIRKKQFALNAKFAALTSFMLNLTKTGMGFVHPTAMVLIITNILGSIAGTAVTYFGWRRLMLKRRRLEVHVESTATIRQLANRYGDFPLLRTPQNFINAVSQNLPVLLLASYFGTNAAGQYTIAIAVLGVPATLVGGSVMWVFYPRLNEALHNGESARPLILRATLGMAASGALPFLIVMLAGPYVFQLFFGELWRPAGVYAQWLSIWIFLQYINRPAVAAIPALGLQGGLLIYEVVSTGSKLLTLWVGFAIYEDPVIAIASFSLTGSAAYVWLIFWVLRKCAAATRTTDIEEAN
jgi:O-antigen/teichoic acid export membrane protein